MKTVFKKITVLAMSCVMAFGLIACGGGANYTADNTEFVIGFSGPLTGDAAVYGVAVNNSAQMAVDEINAAGGLNGVNFKLVATDDTHDATKVATNYATMLESGMQVSLGTVTTAPGLEFSKLSAADIRQHKGFAYSNPSETSRNHRLYESRPLRKIRSYAARND